MTVAHKKPFDKSKGQGTRFNSFDALRSVVAKNREVEPVRHKPQPQPEPIKFDGPCNAWYETERNGRKTRIFLVEVKKDVAYYKERECDKHSQNMSLAKFVKFYKLA